MVFQGCRGDDEWDEGERGAPRRESGPGYSFTARSPPVRTAAIPSALHASTLRGTREHGLGLEEDGGLSCPPSLRPSGRVANRLRERVLWLTGSPHLVPPLTLVANLGRGFRSTDSKGVRAKHTILTGLNLLGALFERVSECFASARARSWRRAGRSEARTRAVGVVRYTVRGTLSESFVPCPKAHNAVRLKSVGGGIARHGGWEKC